MIPAGSDYWVRYSEARTNAVVLVAYGLLLAAVLAHTAANADHAYVWAGAFFAAVVGYTWLVEAALREWGRAKMARESYRAWNLTAMTFSVITATVVLKALTEATGGEASDV